jgi:hypothetical protein
MLADTARQLTRMADFAGLPATPERISQAVERSSADRMRESAKKLGQGSMSIKGRRPDLPLVSSAKSGGWRSDLPETQVARIEAAWGDIMACLGYELVTRAARHARDSSLIGLLAAGVASRTGKRREEVFAGDISTLPGALPTRAVIR